MPANSNSDLSKEKFIHVSNKGVDRTVLFKDDQDFEVFLSYLNEYLSSPQRPSDVKKTFTVRGKSFKGTPHQPKNYFNKIELLSYELRPDRYHLVLKPKDSALLERFIRSLCTRYSIYYNKKYKRTGSLFAGPYKSVWLKNINEVLLLNRLFHKDASSRSSFAEYIGKRSTPWVDTGIVSAYVTDKEASLDNDPTAEEEEILKRISLFSRQLERSILESTPEIATESTVSIDEPKTYETNSPTRLPEIFGATFIFVILTMISFRNIQTTKAASVAISESQIKQAVLSEFTLNPESVSESASPSANIVMVTVKITDGAKTVNIRQKPSTSAEKIGEAIDAESFEFVSKTPNWYEIKMKDGTNGFISNRYIQK